MFNKNLNWKLIIFIHLCLAFIIGYFVFAFAAIIVFMFGDFTVDQVWGNLSLNHFMSVIDLNFLVYFSMIGIIYIHYYIEKVKKIEKQNSKLQVQIANTKLNALKSQLHPHFMFNTLNSISSLIEIDKEKSQNLIADFGDLFRDILDSTDDHLIPLKQEIDMLKKYIEIISVRFSDHLYIAIDVKEKLQDALVPSLLLQPLLENTIKHGYSYSNTELKVIISIYKHKKYLFIKIENNGALLNDSLEELMNSGIGLKNTVDRLTTLFDDDFEFNLKNNHKETGVETIIKIPYLLKKSHILIN
jgi:LytS/YehU family sensor histidine kinase